MEKQEGEHSSQYKYYVFGHCPTSEPLCLKNKDRTMDNVEKYYICTNVPRYKLLDLTHLRLVTLLIMCEIFFHSTKRFHSVMLRHKVNSTCNI
jgi:hypothetical protein